MANLGSGCSAFIYSISLFNSLFSKLNKKQYLRTIKAEMVVA